MPILSTVNMLATANFDLKIGCTLLSKITYAPKAALNRKVLALIRPYSEFVVAEPSLNFQK